MNQRLHHDPLIRDGGTSALRWQGIAASGGSVFGLWSSTGLNNGVWHHVVGTYSSAQHTAALYVDGDLVNSNTNASSAIATTAHPFQIGARHNGDTFGGSIDDVAVYDHALTAAQVAAHYASRATTGPNVLSYADSLHCAGL